MNVVKAADAVDADNFIDDIDDDDEENQPTDYAPVSKKRRILDRIQSPLDKFWYQTTT